MDWKTKAQIQNLVAALPPKISYALYYWLQRRFGGLRFMDPCSRLQGGINIWRTLKSVGHDGTDKVFFEVGTGRAPLAPLAFWLMGARETITIDLNPYVKDELIAESLAFILKEQEKIKALFGDDLDQQRWQELLHFSSKQVFDRQAFLDCCAIRYIAPGDATATGLPDKSIDYHTSYTVFEHIPEPVLEDILREGNRLLSADGLFVHRIDYSDHFSHSDTSISAINFLQYSDHQWRRFADNRYMYMNRLRHDDFQALFDRVNHRVILDAPDTDSSLLEVLHSEAFILDDRFAGKSEQTLSITGSWLVTRPA